MSDDGESPLLPFQQIVHCGLGDTALDYFALKNAWKTAVSPGLEHLAKRRLLSKAVSNADLLVDPGQPFVTVTPDDWSGLAYHATDDGEDEEYRVSFHDNNVKMEYTTRHPGTSIDSDVEDGEDIEYKYPDFQPTEKVCSGSPITTTAAEHLYCIAFAGPGGVVTELKATYPMQLSARIDEARKCLALDCFEYKLKCMDLQSDSPDNIPTHRELKRWKDGIVRMPKERSVWDSDSEESEADDDDSAYDEPVMPKEGKTFDDDTRAILAYEAASGNFAYSRCFRVRVPLEGVCGIRLQAAKADPNSEGSDDIGAVLVLEVSCRPTKSAFAARRIFAKYYAENEFALVDDWTPNGVASRSTRYYLYGNLAELKETAALMTELCPGIGSMLASKTSPGNSIRASTSVEYAAAPNFSQSEDDAEMQDTSDKKKHDDSDSDWDAEQREMFLTDVREAICKHCGERYFRGHAGYPCFNCGGGKAKSMKSMEPPPLSAWNGKAEGAMEVFESQCARMEPEMRAFVRLAILGPGATR